MTMVKPAPLFAVFMLLTGCEGYAFQPDLIEMDIRWRTLNFDSLQIEYRKHGGDSIYDVLGFALPNETPCVVFTEPPEDAYDHKVFSTLFHEASHCEGWRHPYKRR